ncbi:meiotic recombination-related protein [Pseudozyma hubeiensis SY62]|uniref:Meiotic recombination-related protein n=1 Tax=Pseudozyma hubeiensis (strain SY62) TaxID=1305764 RepID=R9P5D1_PSEHS|nr:meiotic recombination-related protein [Pseudozyma hubeiensis SY62]GAC93300.1 meiotic recombination-related protein [Pseudozyma hubeiensis SY62]
MSAITHSQAMRTASEAAATASLPAESEDTTNARMQNGSTSAIAIEVMHGRLGCAVFLEEEQQLLLCEDLPCDFAFDDRDAVSTAHIAGLNNEVAGAEGVPIATDSNDVAVGQPPYGYVGSSEQHNSVMEVRPAKYFQVSIGLSSLDDITTFSRTHAPSQDESLSALVVLDARVATSRSALSVGPLVSSLRARCEVGRTIALVPLCLDSHLFLDDNTLKSLSICSSDAHGFVHAKQGREGFSILGALLAFRSLSVLGHRKSLQTDTHICQHSSTEFSFSHDESHMLKVKEQGKVTVRSGVDTHLDELREQQVRLPGQLDRVAADLRTEAAFRPTRTLHVVYFPQIGYLICVPGGEMIDMQADPTLEQQFASEDCVYLKNSRMSHLDNSVGPTSRRT